jgi:polyhydroxyalkanoate synthase
MGNMMKSLTGLSLPMPQLAQIQSDYISNATEMWNQSLQGLQGDVAAGAKKGPTSALPPVNGRPTQLRP